MRGVVRAAAGAYDRESCCMDSIVRTCEAEAGAVGAQWKQFLRCLPLRLGRCCVLAAMRVHGRLLTIAHSCPCSPVERRKKDKKYELKLNLEGRGSHLEPTLSSYDITLT